jgi:hypothetical protein
MEAASNLGRFIPTIESDRGMRRLMRVHADHHTDIRCSLKLDQYDDRGGQI